MSKFLSLICAAGVAAIAALSAVQAGEPAHATSAVYRPSAEARDALFQRVKSKPCCYARGQFFNSTPSTCYRQGGRTVAYEYCQRQYYGWGNGGGYQGQWNNNGPYQGQWNNGPYQGRWNNGYGGFNAQKPCCFNRGQYYNSTPKTCRKYGGQTVPQEYCAWAYGYQGGGGYGQQPY